MQTKQFTKNKKIELDIIDMTKEGLGVAKVDSQVFFVKDAFVGDRVSAIITKSDNKESAVIYAKKVDIIKKSEYREEAKCKVCDACGGCQVMGLSYIKQLLLKENFVKNDLIRIGGFDKKFIEKKFEGIIGMNHPYRFRNKMQVPFAMRDGKVVTGFYAGRTHYIVENDNCITGFEESKTLLDIIKKLHYTDKYNLTIYDENTGEGLLREVMLRKGNKTNEISLTLIVNDKKINNYKIREPLIINEKLKTKKEIDSCEYLLEKYKKLAETIIDEYNKCECSNISKLVTITLNINIDKNNVLFGKNNIVLYGKGYINDEILGLNYHISPESFYQVNNVQTEKLYNVALDYVDDILKNDNVTNALDLYCGIGTITLLLSKKVDKILGIEIVENAIKNARENAKINNINNVEFKCMDVNELKLNENMKYDLISVDPPRKGLDKKTIEYIKSNAPENLLYISCDPATLSRDLKILCNDEKVCYNIKRIKCVDMFPHTMHVETVVSLHRR